MKVKLIFATALTMVAFAGVAHADPELLAKEKECMTCHAVDGTMPKAPAFTDIARKYDEAMAPMLVKTVMSGGVGHWGPNAMPGQAARVDVSEEEAQVLVDWILSLH
jgi:cytochrome c551/c552